MIRITALLFVTLVTSSVAAKENTSNKNIDDLVELGYSIKQKNIDSVLLIANSVLSKSEQQNYDFGVVKAYTLASYYYFEKYQYDTAKFLLNKSLHHFTTFPQYRNTIDHGRVFLHLGYIAVKEHNLSISIKYAANALAIFKITKDCDSILSAITLLGGAECQQENYVRGLGYYFNSLKIKTENNYAEEKYISDFSNIAAIYIKIGQHEKAIPYSKKALGLSKKYKHIERQLINLNNLGTIYSAKHKFDSALYFYQECLTLASKNGRKEKKEIALYNVGNTFYKLGEHKKSITLTQDLLSVQPDLAVSRNAEVLIAKNHFSLGEIRNAIATASKIFKTLHQYPKNKEATIELTAILAQAYEAVKKYDSALFFLNLNHALTDSLYNLKSQHEISLLYAELENLEKEKELDILQKNKLIENKKNSGVLIVLVCSTSTIVLVALSIILMFRNKEKNEKIKNAELKRELEKKRRDLHQQTLKIIYMNNGLIEIETSVKKLQLQIDGNQSKDIELILATISNNKSLEAEWENFKTYFNQVYEQFTQKVENRFPNLSTSEKRLISLIKMELKNREIASILNIDSASVKMAKYRLKKKLQLPDEIDIQLYLHNFN